MTSSEIKRVLSGLGIDTSVSKTDYMQIDNFKYFNMCSDGNHVISYYNDLISFDFENELIKIKEKEARLVSGVMNTSGAVVSGKTILMLNAPLRNNTLTFRHFKTGDIIYYVNKSTLKRNASLDSKIVSISGPTLDIEKNIPNLDTYYMCYASSEFYNAVLDEKDNRTAVVYTDNTSHIADVYMTFESVAGFSFQSRKTNVI
jgi:hypothetical protein